MAMGEEYEVICEENKKLNTIMEGLAVSRFVHDNMRVNNIGCSIPLKGNKKIIQKLHMDGWKDLYREKRGNKIIQILEKKIVYQKYAIFKTPFGKRYMYYYDNIRDLQRDGISYIRESSLPVIVNRKGGYTTFKKEYEKDFLEIVEVPEGKEPLTREEMYLTNAPDFHYGYIDRAGNTYSCGFEGHYDLAEALEKEEYGESILNPENELEKLGWIRISRPAPYTPDNLEKRCAYFSMRNTKFRSISKKQYEKMYELGMENEDCVKWYERDQ